MIKQLAFGASLACLAALSGCASTSPAFEQSFGQTLRVSLASQVIDPAASSNANPVNGVDSNAALGAQLQYARSYAVRVPHQGALAAGSGK